MGHCVHNQSANQRHFEFRGTLPKPWGDASLSVFGFPRSRGAGVTGKTLKYKGYKHRVRLLAGQGRRPQPVERRQIENIKTAIEFARRDDIA